MKPDSLFVFVMSLCLLASCGNSSKTNDDQSKIFHQLVQTYTKGTISVKDEIMIRFTTDVQGARQGDVIDGDVFTFSPKIQGDAYWVDRRTVAFKPSARLSPSASYSCEVAVARFFPSEEDEMGSVKFTFRTKTNDFHVALGSLLAQGKMYRLEGSVLLSDMGENDKVEQLLSIRDKNLNARLKWIHQSDEKHLFYVDSIRRQDASIKLWIDYDGAALGIDKKGSLDTEIPGLDSFKYINSRVEQEPAQVLNVEFSDPVNDTQDLNGLISLKGLPNAKVVRELNFIKIYADQRISGNKILRISRDLKNIDGFKLGEDLEINVNFASLKPNIRYPKSGVIVPSAGNDCIVPFEAVNLSAVDLYVIKILEKNIPYFLQSNQLNGDNNLAHYGRLILKKKIDLSSDRMFDPGVWNSFSLNLKQLIATEPGAIYRVEMRFKKDYSLYPGCNKKEEEDGISEEEEENDGLDLLFDKGLYWPRYSYHPDYEWRERNNPCHVSYYQNKYIYKNVIASNLGLTLKSNGQGQFLAVVNDLISAQPKAAVTVRLFNHQNELMSEGQTNSDGMLELQAKGMPWLAVAQMANEKTYLRVDDGSALSYASFDISGNISKKGLNAFFYGERGVWRPGDTIHLTFVVNDMANPLPEKQPVTLYLYNPESKLMQKKVNVNPEGKFYKFTLTTSESDPTGNWLVKAKIGGAVFSKTIKIETIKPNRLKINLEFKDDVLTAGKPIDGKIKVDWMHGAPGKNLKIRTDLIFKPTTPSFSHLPGFVFSDPAKEMDMREETVFEGTTDASGNARFNFSKDMSRFAPSMLKAIFTLKAFEPGGEFSIVQQSRDYSPFDTYVGIRMPEKPKNSWHYNSGTGYNVEVATVDKNGEAVDVSSLKVEVYKLEWEWWWHAGKSNLAYYIQRNYNKSVLRKTIYTKNGKGLFELRLDKNSWGRYLVRVVDPKGHSTGIVTYFDWPWRKSSEGAGGATRLNFRMDKKTYLVGENIKVNVPGEKGARALVSVEAGTRILQKFWIDIEDDGGKFEIKATPNMAPNAYLNISMIQPYAKTINENPIRLYGILPVFVEDQATKLLPVLKMPETVEPKQTFKVEVSEAKKREMTYTIAIVDEGLLDITNFKTPDIHGAFFQRQALLVKSWDMFDDVSGAYGGKIERVFGIGGDEALLNKDKKDDNRFKPVVLFSGPHHLDKGKKAVHSFTMPKYIGSVKTMVIAGDANAYGSIDQSMSVKKPVMVLATLPRVLGPGEKVVLPVSAFIMKEGITKAKVSIEPNTIFRVSESTKTIDVDGLGEYNVNFDLTVAERTGQGHVKIEVETNKGRADYEIDIQVRNPNLPIAETQNFVLEPDASQNIAWKINGMEGTNKVVLECSSMPPLNISKRMDYLLRYPYGCVEQTVSAVFPQLYINELINASAKEQEQIQHNIEGAIQDLVKFQLSDGSFSYWPGNTYVSLWGSCYATHFLIEAEQKGYSLPFGMKDKAIEFLQSEVSAWTHRYSSNYYNLNQSYKLYVLALAKKPDIGSMNRLRQKNEPYQQANWRLASAYAVIGKKDVAEELLDMSKLEVSDYEDFTDTYGSALRDYAMLLQTLSDLGKKAEAARLVKRFSEVLSDDDQWLSTQTTAWMLMSLAKSKALLAGENEKLNYEFTVQNRKKTKIQSEDVIKRISWMNDSDSTLLIRNKMKNVLFVTLNSEGLPLRDRSAADYKNVRLDLKFMNLEGHILDPANIAQGTDFKAVYNIRYDGVQRKQNISNMALRQIFPSGWEIINSRLYGDGYLLNGDKPDYQDIRDDRVYMFFNLQSDKNLQFEVLLNAAYEGEFVLPATIIEAMYSDKYRARTQSITVKVSKK